MIPRQPPPSSPRTRPLPARAALLVTSALLFGVTVAQETPPPKGYPVGRWVLAPSLVIGYDYSTNVFQQPEERDPLADYSIVVEPGITATLPFRNSYFDVSYKATGADYGKAFPDEQIAHELGSRLSLLFSTKDRLTFGGRYVWGVAQTEEFDPGGEVLYGGDSFNLYDTSIELSREVYGKRGYLVRINRGTLHFDPDDDPAFFDYEGWSGEAEYREPLSASLWIVGGYSGRRFDHFCPGTDPLGDPCSSSEPFRKESGDTATLGLRGTLPGQKPFLVRLGYTDYRYDVEGSQGFNGVTAEVNFALPVGGGSSVRIDLARRPYPSFYLNNNFYLVNRIGGQFEHAFRNDSTAGARFSYWTSKYPEPIVDPGFPDDGVVREDRQTRAELYANVMLVKRVGIALSVSQESRDSNVAGLDYDNWIYFVGITYGAP